MKFFMSIFLCLIIIVTGCDNFFEHEVKFINNSSYTVCFQLERYGDSIYTMAAGDSFTLEIYNDPKLVFQGNPRVSYESGTSVCIFNLPCNDCIIYNYTPYNVLVTEKNYKLGEEKDDNGILIAGSYVNVKKSTDELGNEIIDSVDMVYPNLSTKLYTEYPSFVITNADDSSKTYEYKLNKLQYANETVYELCIMF